MSVPAPLTVQELPVSDWSPTVMGLPTSAQDHPAGQDEADGAGSGTAPGPLTDTPLKVAVARDPLASELAAIPASTAAGMVTTKLVPGTSVNRAPSLEVAAWNPSPRRCTSR